MILQYVADLHLDTDDPMTNWRTVRLWLASLILLGASCTRPLGSTDIVGTYRANHGLGEDVLNVKADGSYHLEFRGHDGTAVERKGTWVFEPLDGEPRVTFNHFLFGFADPTDKPGYWSVELERSRGRLRLFIDYDRGFYYQKQDWRQ